MIAWGRFGFRGYHHELYWVPCVPGRVAPGNYSPGATRPGFPGFQRSIKGMQVATPVIAHTHHVSADRALAVEDIELPRSRFRIIRPRARPPRLWRD